MKTMKLIACIITSYFFALTALSADKSLDLLKIAENFVGVELGTPIEKFWKEVSNIEPFNPFGEEDDENSVKKLRENPLHRQMWVKKFPSDRFLSGALFYFQDGKLAAKSLSIRKLGDRNEIDTKGFIRWCILKWGDSFERKVVENTHAGEVFYYTPQMLWHIDRNLVRLTFLPEMRFVELKGKVEFFGLEILSKDITDIKTSPERSVSEEVRTKLFFQVEKIVRDLKR